MITFADYMEKVLYGPQGYYSSGNAKSGREGDYFTAPDVSPVFGRLLIHIFAGWRNRVARRPFHLVEVGAGEGRLAKVMAESLDSDFPEESSDFVYTAVEKSRVRRSALELAVGSMPCPFKVLPDLESLAASSVSGCLFANELIDAFPVHRVRQSQGRLEEAFVEQEDDHRRLVWREPSTSLLAEYLQRIEIVLPEAYETEINLEMRKWVRDAVRVLAEGAIVLIDYGRPAHEYYAPERDRGTLRCFSGHRVSDPFSHRSSSVAATSLDWTSDVDFTSLALEAQEAGLDVLAYMDMSSFLMQGAEGYLRRSSAGAESAVGLRYLVHPEGLGAKFQVLILGKNVDRQDWRFQGNRLLRLGLQRRSSHA